MPERIVGLTGGWKLPICLQETREFPGSASQIHLSQSPPMTTTRLLLRGTPARGPRLGALLGLCVLSLVFTLAFTASTSGTSGAATLRMAAKHKASSAKSLSAFQACLSKHGLKLPTRGGSKGGPPSGFSGGTPPRLRWHAAESWWIRRLRCQFENPGCTQAMRQPAAKGRVPGRSRWILEHGVRLLPELHEAPWRDRAIGHAGFEHVDFYHCRHLLAHLSGRPDRLQGLAPDGIGHHIGEFGLRGSRLARRSRLSDSLKGPYV